MLDPRGGGEGLLGATWRRSAQDNTVPSLLGQTHASWPMTWQMSQPAEPAVYRSHDPRLPRP